jgi:hypothetical protein
MIGHGMAARMPPVEAEGVSERGKHIARQWQREIDEEIRQATVREEHAGRWRAVSWIGLWLLWLALLVALVMRISPLR